MIDALYMKVREEGRVVSRGVMVCIGINEDGRRELLGMMLDATPKALKEEIHRPVRTILDAPDLNAARMMPEQTLAKYTDKATKAMRILEEDFDDAAMVLCMPDKYRQRLRTTNAVERFNEEVRRREKVIRIFPNRESVIRLIGALMMELDERWNTERKVFDMAEYFEWRKARQKVSAKVTRIG